MLKGKAVALALALAANLIAMPADATDSDPAIVALDIPAAWNLGFKGSGAAVAFIDSELDTGHPEFQGGVVQGYCVITEANSPQVCPNGQKEMLGTNASSWSSGDDDHGNMVAGNIRRVAPEAGLLPIRAIGGTPALLKASEFLLRSEDEFNVVALSLSFGTDLFWGAGPRVGWSSITCEALAQVNPEMRAFAENLRQLREKGLVTFAASGNSPTLDFNRFFFPACLKSVVSVGALGRDNLVAPYVTLSTDVEFLAPDYAVVATGGGGVRQGGGTSAATPMLAGTFALLRAGFPSASPEVVLSTMKATSLTIDDVLMKGLKVPQLGAAARSLQLLSLSSNSGSASLSPAPDTSSSSKKETSASAPATSSTSPSLSPPTATPGSSSSDGASNAQRAGESENVVLRTLSTWLKWSSADQSTLGENRLREKIAKLLTYQGVAMKLVCTGITAPNSNVTQVDLAKRRAANACAYARKLSPGLKTQYQVKESSVRSYANSVLLQISIY